MKRIVLFSAPVPQILDKVLESVFPLKMQNKVFAYMPSDGANAPQKYIDEWEGYAKKRNAKFVLVNNAAETQEEINKLREANILMVSGGNTFTLLNNLRKSGLDKAIKEFAKKDEFVLAGFSAGALVMTPTIQVCNLPGYDENLVGLKDLNGLGIVDFEVFPHYSEEHALAFNEYSMQAKNEVKKIKDDEMIVIDL